MAILFHIHASPRQDSFSARLAQAYLAEFRRLRPEDRVQTLDLFKADLPPFYAPAAAAKYAVLAGQQPQGEAQKQWKTVVDYTDRLKEATWVVISSAMWNFSIPYRLKHYIDIIVQPGLTFRYSTAEGYTGLVTDRPATLLLARGGAYGPGSGAETFDMQRTYLESILRFIGFQDIRVVTVEPTLQGGPELADQALQKAQEQARQAARKTFGKSGDVTPISRNV